MTLPGIIEETSFVWNAGANRYISSVTGQFVSKQAVSGALETVIAGSGAQMEALATSLTEGTLSLAEWQLAMGGEIKKIHLASTMLQRGGWAQMSSADFGLSGNLIRNQYGYLNNFSSQIASGAQRLDGTLITRAKMYANAGRASGEQFNRKIKNRENAVQEERRRLGVADHCQDAGTLEGCVTLAAKGWQPAGTLPDIGGAPCVVNCKCQFEYRTSEGEEIQ